MDDQGNKVINKDSGSKDSAQGVSKEFDES
jgi:hypothetical protein